MTKLGLRNAGRFFANIELAQCVVLISGLIQLVQCFFPFLLLWLSKISPCKHLYLVLIRLSRNFRYAIHGSLNFAVFKSLNFSFKCIHKFVIFVKIVENSLALFNVIVELGLILCFMFNIDIFDLLFHFFNLLPHLILEFIEALSVFLNWLCNIFAIK